jgi:hypothetical protein
MEMEAVKKRVIHQYSLSAMSPMTRKVDEMVPVMVRTAASVAKSSLSHECSRVWRKPRPGVASKMSCMELLFDGAPRELRANWMKLLIVHPGTRFT